MCRKVVPSGTQRQIACVSIRDMQPVKGRMLGQEIPQKIHYKRYLSGNRTIGEKENQMYCVGGASDLGFHSLSLEAEYSKLGNRTRDVRLRTLTHGWNWFQSVRGDMSFPMRRNNSIEEYQWACIRSHRTKQSFSSSGYGSRMSTYRFTRKWKLSAGEKHQLSQFRSSTIISIGESMTNNTRVLVEFSY